MTELRFVWRVTFLMTFQKEESGFACFGRHCRNGKKVQRGIFHWACQSHSRPSTEQPGISFPPFFSRPSCEIDCDKISKTSTVWTRSQYSGFLSFIYLFSKIQSSPATSNTESPWKLFSHFAAIAADLCNGELVREISAGLLTSDAHSALAEATSGRRNSAAPPRKSN